MSFADLRSFLDHLRATGNLLTIEEEVDPVYGISAWIRRTSDVAGPTLLFPHVKGHDMPVVGGVFNSPDKAILALEVDDHAAAVDRFAQAIEHPILPVTVGSGSCQEVVWRGEDVDLSKLPIPTYGE